MVSLLSNRCVGHSKLVVGEMDTELSRRKTNAKQMAIIVVFLYAVTIVALSYSIASFYEDVLLTLLGLVGSALFGLIMAWFVNSHLARDLEKRKKKYDIKYESYSTVYRNLESIVQLGKVWHLHNLVSSRVEGKKENGVVQQVDSNSLIMAYVSELEILRAIVGEGLHEGLLEELSQESLMGVSFEEAEGLDEKGFRDRIKKSLKKHVISIIRWWVIMLKDLDKSLLRVKLIGSLDIGQSVGDFVKLFTFQLFKGEPLDSQMETLILDMEKDDIGLSQLASSIEFSLMRDLDETL